MAATPLLISTHDLTMRIAQDLPHWTCSEGKLCRTFRTTGWKSTLMIANAIAFLAEAAWHHPDLMLGYGSIEVRLSDHEAGGISEKDFALAARIEALVFASPDGVLTGPPEADALLKPFARL